MCIWRTDWIILLAESWIGLRRPRGSGASPRLKAHIKFLSLFTQSLHVTWEVTECVLFARYTAYNPVWHLSVFGRCFVDGKNKPLHVVCKQVFKHHSNAWLNVHLCEDFIYVLHFWLICGCGDGKERQLRSVNLTAVTQWGDYNCGFFSCDITLKHLHKVPLCAVWQHTNAGRSAKNKWKHGCHC